MILHETPLFRGMLVAAALLGGGFSAQAAEHPPFAPTRDVVVAYQVQASHLPAGLLGGGDAQGARGIQDPHSIRMIYSAASGRVRIEPASVPGYMLIDRTAGRITMGFEPLRSFMDMPFDARAGAGLLLNDKMKFVRGGVDKVAGMACSLWTVTSDRTVAHLCITGDGVILRGEGSDPKRGEAKLLATDVTFAAQPAASFSPPPGFHRMELPAGVMLPGVTLPGMGGNPVRSPG